MKKILVTGSNGYIGSHLAAHLIDEGYEVVLSDIQENSVLNTQTYYQVDFCKKETFCEEMFNVDCIYFFTGKTGNAEEGFQNPSEFIAGNETALVNMLSYITTLKKVPKIIFPSTRLLYKGGESKITEESELNPKSIYSVTKLACEQYLKVFSDCFNIDYSIFRISLPYGSIITQNRVSYGVMSFLVDCARNNKNLKVYGDGGQKASLIHISDLTNILIQAGLNDRTNREIFNIGGPDHLTMKEVVDSIAQKFNVSSEQVEWPQIILNTEQGALVFNSDKIENLLNYEYKYSFYSWLNQEKI